MINPVTRSGRPQADADVSTLPEFERPPLVEVAIGLMFDPLKIGAVALAQLFPLWHEAYPEVEEHPAIPASPTVPGLILEAGVPHLRLWFRNTSGRLIQVQRDRLVVNWRKESPGSDYPRFGTLKQELESRFAEFSDFVARVQPARQLKVNAIEATYVNQIPLTDDINSLADIVSLLRPAPEGVGQPLETNLLARYDVSKILEQPTATLVVNAQRSPVVDPPVAVLQLSCISPVDDSADAFQTLDRARDQVVRSFKDITTAKMHGEWGLRA